MRLLVKLTHFNMDQFHLGLKIIEYSFVILAFFYLAVNLLSLVSAE